MIDQLDNYPCVCGHPKNLHFQGAFVAGCQKVSGYGIRGTRWVDNCIEFIPDNLKYLEMKYKQHE